MNNINEIMDADHEQVEAALMKIAMKNSMRRIE